MALQRAEDLPELCRSLSVPEEASSLKGAIQAVQREVAESEAAANAVSDLEKQHSAKLRLAEEKAEQARSLAAELALPGAEAAWKPAAMAEREAIRAAETARADSVLQEAVQQARQKVNAIRRQHTILSEIRAGCVTFLNVFRRTGAAQRLETARLEGKEQIQQHIITANVDRIARHGRTRFPCTMAKCLIVMPTL